MLPKILLAPNKYVQGPNLLHSLSNFIPGLSPFFLFTPTTERLTREIVVGSLLDSGSVIHRDFSQTLFEGECCWDEIDRVRAHVENAGSDSIVAIGGGKCIDTAKQVANDLDIAIIAVPSVCSTDAPCSALSVIYTNDGECLLSVSFHQAVVGEVSYYPSSPDAVIVDTQLIADAPVEYLIAGIGDALATHFEAEQASIARNPSCCGGAQTVTALALARLCYDTLIENSLIAVESCKAGVASPQFEAICEANTLLSGLGFESGGLAVAHALHNGLTALPETHGCQHGEKVNLGTLTQLVLQGADPDLIDDTFQFCYDVGLPITLEDVGVVDCDREHLMVACHKACEPEESTHNMPFPVSPEFVLSLTSSHPPRTLHDALVTADAIGKKLKLSMQ